MERVAASKADCTSAKGATGFDAPSRQSSVNNYFAAESSFWHDIYNGMDVYALIHQERLAQVLAWVDEMGLREGASVLDAGCGAGLTAVALAQRRLRVHATDAAPAMVESARRQATQTGVSDRVELATADVHELPFGEGTFDLVVALGVIPWLHSPSKAVDEIARVTRPGGRVIVTFDNAARLNYMLDPRFNRRLGRAREAAKRVLRRLNIATRIGVVPSLHSPEDIDAFLSSAKLRKEQVRTLGFGPFTFLGRNLLPRALGVRVHRYLQIRADRGSALHFSGSQGLVLAKKPTSRSEGVQLGQ
jgi:ubiquinone/menaquinone biosynthesis C-methylase UbiE